MTKKRTMAGSAVFLAVFALAAKILGAFYRIPLTNLLGAEGMGMYQLVFSIYALVLSLTTGGIPLAVSRIVAEKKTAHGDTVTVLKSALLFTAATSVFIALILVFTGQYIVVLQGNSAVSFGYTLIAPAVVVVSLTSILRGWFQGNFDVVPTAVSQLIEQVFKLSFGLLFAKMLVPKGVVYAVYGALLGIAVSEVAALFYMVVSYAVKKKKLILDTPRDNFKDTFGGLLKISFIFAIAGFIIPFSQFIDGIVIVNVLKATGVSTSYATAAYGLFSGTVTSIVNMPVVLTISLSVALIPVIGADRVNRDLQGIALKCATSVKLALVIGLPAAILMFVYSKPIITFLYPRLSGEENALATQLLSISCFSVLFSAAREIYNSLLMALDKTKTVVWNTTVAVVIKTCATVVLLFYTGIAGAAWGSVTFGAAATFLDVISFNKLLGKKVKLVKNVSTIAVSGAIMMVIAMILYYTLPTGALYAAIGCVCCAAVYLFCLMLFKVFDKGELNGIPLSRIFDSISVKIRFWEKKQQ